MPSNLFRSWIVWGCLAFLVAGIYYFVWPKNKLTQHPGFFYYFVLRWGHSLVWLLLATSFFLREKSLGAPPFLPNVFAMIGGIMYALFILIFLTA